MQTSEKKEDGGYEKKFQIPLRGGATVRRILGSAMGI